MCNPPASITLACRSVQSCFNASILLSVVPFFCFSSFSSASRFPPKTISVPRPAILVAIVTAPGRPALTIILASNSCCLALSTLCLILAFLSIADNSSEVSTDAVPTNTGAPLTTISCISEITVSNFSS